MSDRRILIRIRTSNYGSVSLRPKKLTDPTPEHYRHLPNIFGNVLRDGPGYAEPVIGGGAATQLIDENEAPGRGVLQDARRLQHLSHEGGDSLHLAVGGADAHHYRVCMKAFLKM
jgi:hypothetical protein